MPIVWVDYRNSSKSENYKEILKKVAINRNVPSILLKHEPKDWEIAEGAGISLQISGHTHKAQMWPLVYVARMIYKNFTYGLQRFKNMQIYTSSGTGTWGPPMRVGTQSEIVVFTFKP